MGETNVVLFGVPVGFIIVGLVQAAKTAGLADRWAPTAAVLLGLCAGGLLGLANNVATGPGWVTAIMTGLMAGLSAAGIYSGTRATLQR